MLRRGYGPPQKRDLHGRVRDGAPDIPHPPFLRKQVASAALRSGHTPQARTCRLALTPLSHCPKRKCAGERCRCSLRRPPSSLRLAAFFFFYQSHERADARGKRLRLGRFLPGEHAFRVHPTCTIFPVLDRILGYARVPSRCDFGRSGARGRASACVPHPACWWLPPLAPIVLPEQYSASADP